VAVRNHEHVLLDIEGQKLAAETDLELEPGELVWLRVKAIDAEQIVLERIKAPEGGGAATHDLDRILQGFGLQATAQQKNLASWMLSHGLGVDEGLLKAALAAWHGATLTPAQQDALVFASSQGLTLSAASLEGLSVFLAARDSWSSYLQAALQAIDQLSPEPTTLAASAYGALIDRARSLLTSYTLSTLPTPTSIASALHPLLGAGERAQVLQALRKLTLPELAAQLPSEHVEQGLELASLLHTLLDGLETQRLLNLSHRLRDEHGRHYLGALFAPSHGRPHGVSEIRLYPPPRRSAGQPLKLEDLRLTFWLETEKLGLLKMEAHWEAGGLCLAVTAESAPVTSFLERQSKLLRARLQPLGVTLKSYSCRTQALSPSTSSSVDDDSLAPPPDIDRGLDFRA
jgi:hypothetical protein